ncbi:MAG: sulfite exporter TauE/SafE family protein [Kineosporiaceae bacterium]|nr:sulfite exporter TauE/SafE family protein [Kineosporiaceae bacterium]MBK8078090.1 sulfite exporter TauE/SafE family protein [Kineosporiaceae bacterium]
MDVLVVLAGLIVGFVVGLTGMGGGALMTPVLVLLFGITPLAAVSSDLVAAAVMKPVGSWVHMRRGTIQWPLVRWLMVGSVPSAFVGVLVLRALGNSGDVQAVVKTSLGVALLVAAAAMVYKAYTGMVARVRREAAARRGEEVIEPEDVPIVVRPLPTVLIGAAGGLIVGMTSVGSGSLIIIALIALYPSLTANRLVGTDLVQAVPLVASAALGHVLFGDFQFDLTASLLLGSIPGVYLGAQLSSRAPGWLIRRALAVVLLASGLKLLDLPTMHLGLVIALAVVLGPLVWAAVRQREGERADRDGDPAVPQPVA